MRITDLTSALTVFTKAAHQHGAATATGDYRSGNKAHAAMLKDVKWLRAENKIAQLCQFLASPDPNFKIWAATYLLPHYEADTLNVLMQLAQANGELSFSAQLTISEWQKGNLRSL